MHNDRIMVLPVGENICHSPRRVQWLRDRGCHCEFAPSYRNACSVLSRSEFDVVLSEYQLPDRTAYPLLDWLVGTPATLLFCARVEDGFLWLKMLERGERCLNAPVLRANDLIPALDQVLTDIANANSLSALSWPEESVMFPRI
jgi:CheY-like chemotaxis protein